MNSCDSCGRPEPELLAVHRMYVTPADWDQEGSVQVLDDTEIWCASCLTTYPHEIAEPPAADQPVN